MYLFFVATTKVNFKAASNAFWPLGGSKTLTYYPLYEVVVSKMIAYFHTFFSILSHVSGYLMNITPILNSPFSSVLVSTNSWGEISAEGQKKTWFLVNIKKYWRVQLYSTSSVKACLNKIVSLALKRTMVCSLEHQKRKQPKHTEM